MTPIAIVLALVGLAVPAITGLEPVPERVIVRTYNRAGVGAGQLEAARRTAALLLQKAGIAVSWLACDRAAPRENDLCARVPGATELAIRIQNADGQASPDALGYSVVDLRARSGRLATVFADRVRAVSARAHVDAGTLLGRAVAHEIGHMLLGTIEHSSEGVMRAHWSDRTLRQGGDAQWQWSRAEVRTMRQALRTRASAHASAATILTTGDRP